VEQNFPGGRERMIRNFHGNEHVLMKTSQRGHDRGGGGANQLRDKYLVAPAESDFQRED